MDMSLFYRIYEQLPRQGPGDARTTRRAFQAVPPLAPAPSILDIGCGVGPQSMELARLTDGRITALDNHQPFLDKLQRRAQAEGLAEHITCQCMDMAHLDFAPASFDLIWSEGAIFILGFKKGLLQWRPFLRPRGVLVVSEIAWLKPDPPVELIEFWGTECPDMMEPAAHLTTAKRCGFLCRDHFVLPETAWWKDYYDPLETVLDRLRGASHGDAEAMSLHDTLRTEIRMYRQYSDYYGYVFFVLQRTD
jgi:cyclopropane fatty-acyl-phospholipid synthase-like methyltransferase